MGVALWAGLAAVCVLSLATPARAAGDLARGDYLMTGVVACGNCHSPREPDGALLADRALSGGLAIEVPGFRAVAPNITPDKETGIGNWTDAEIAAAIREGKRPDGSVIGPPMPIEFYRHMSDTDLAAIVASLRAAKPVRHVVEKSTYRIPLPPAYGPPVGHVADVPKTDRLAYGRYLADIGHCMECHTPTDKGRPIVDRFGGGGRELPAPAGGTVKSANLTPGNPDGIVRWTDAQVKKTMATGVRPDGRKLVPLMAFDWYRTMKDDDMGALIAYLRTLKPVAN